MLPDAASNSILEPQSDANRNEYSETQNSYGIRQRSCPVAYGHDRWHIKKGHTKKARDMVCRESACVSVASEEPGKGADATGSGAARKKGMSDECQCQ